MKVKHISNPEAFFKVIDQCGGTVELVTGEGDRLNLKSKLCQLISLSNVFAANTEIPELEIIAHEPEDAKKILDYMIMAGDQ